MWSHLPLGELHQTTNYGCAGGVCEGRYHNIYHAQARVALVNLEAKIVDLRKSDPTGYYSGDLDDLLDAYKTLTDRLNGPFA